MDPVLALAHPPWPPGVHRAQAALLGVRARAALPARGGDGMAVARGVRWLRAAAAALAIGCAVPPARADAPGLPPVLNGDESAAATEGARALLYNPAGLGLRYPSEWVLAWTRGHDGAPLSPGFGVAASPAIETGHGLFAMRNLGLFASYAKRRSQAYGFGLAGGGEGMRMGLTTAWLVAGGDVSVDARFGAMSRPVPWLSLGGVVEHVFQPAFQGATLGRDYTLALRLRPIAFKPAIAHEYGTRLTLTADVVMSEGGDASQARVRLGANVEPIPGLLLHGSVEDHGGFHVGPGLAGGRAIANLRPGYQAPARSSDP